MLELVLNIGFLKMKKISFVSLLFCLQFSIEAQMYSKAFCGYAFSSDPQVMTSYEIIDNTENIYVSKFKNGQGMNLGLAVGYQFRHGLSFELTCNTQVFSTDKISVPQHDYRLLLTNFSFRGYFGDIKYTDTFFQFATQFGYTIEYKNLGIFLKAGPDFMIAKSTYQFSYVDWELDSWEWYPNQIVKEVETKGGFSIGIQSSLGMEYRLNNDIRLFGEFLSVVINYKNKESEVTRYDVEGIDRLNEVDDRTETFEEGEKVNFGQIGFNIGLKYIFNRKRVDKN
jgi:hypothetical protein